MTIPANRLANIRRRVNRARDNVGVTCPASRHVHQIADALAAGRPYSMLEEEPAHVAGSLYAVIEDLWKLRALTNRSCGQDAIPAIRSSAPVVAPRVGLSLQALSTPPQPDSCSTDADREEGCRSGSRSDCSAVPELHVNLNIDALPSLPQLGDDTTGKG